MSAERSADVNGKAPVQQPTNPARAPGAGLVNVQPARLDDLQPKYAQQIQHGEDNPDAHGWYASFIHGLGECLGCLGAIPCCFCCPNPFKPVAQGEVGLITRFGRFVNPHDDHSRIYILIDVLPDSNVPSIPVWSK
jgi:hypothetical protein